jgi:hypothetical protein
MRNGSFKSLIFALSLLFGSGSVAESGNPAPKGTNQIPASLRPQTPNFETFRKELLVTEPEPQSSNKKAPRSTTPSDLKNGMNDIFNSPNFDVRKQSDKIESMKTLGGVNGGGGDEIGLSFEAAMQSALIKMSRNMPQLYAKLVKRKLNSVLQTLRILTVDVSISAKYQSILQDSVAANDPVNRIIIINRFKWLRISNPVLAEGIALHELASILRLEKTGRYPISSLYVKYFGLDETALSDELMVRDRIAQALAMNSDLGFFSALSLAFEELPKKEESSEGEVSFRPMSGLQIEFDCGPFNFSYYPRSGYFTVGKLKEAEAKLKEYFSTFKVSELRQGRQGGLRVHAQLDDAGAPSILYTEAELEFKFMGRRGVSETKMNDYLEYQLKLDIVRHHDRAYHEYSEQFTCDVDVSKWDL